MHPSKRFCDSIACGSFDDRNAMQLCFSAPNAVVDVGVVFGASGDQSEKAFRREIDFVKEMLDSFDISQRSSLFGSVTSGSTSSVAFRIGDALDRRSTESSLTSIAYPGAGYNLKRAIRVAVDSLFSESNGARADAAKSLIIFVNKDSQDQLDTVSQEIADVNKLGIKVVVVAMGKDIDDKKVKNIFDLQETIYILLTGGIDRNTVIDASDATLPGK